MSRTRYTRISLLLLIGGLFLAACAPSTSAAPTLSSSDLITQAAMTVAVELTKSAALTPSPTASLTPAPTNTTAPTAAPAQPTQPPAATATTPKNLPTATSGDAASFVADLTVPDGTAAAPGAVFEKSWRIKNTGTTTWTSSYSVVVIDGERMGAPDSIPMPKEVRPGETVDVSVKLTAPTNSGSYQTFFRLRNANGQYFQLDGTGDLWVKIVVGLASTATPGGATATVSPTPGPSLTPTNTPLP